MLRQIALLLFSCSALPAQVERAAIVGNVTDKSGAAMPGVDGPGHQRSYQYQHAVGE